jgi:hypothetical protein
VYYVLYANDYEIPSKVAFDPEEPSIGRIRVDYITPPHNLTSLKLCLSRVEKNPTLVYADLFEDISGVTPLKEGQILNLRIAGPGLSPNEPMAVVLSPPTPGPDGRYVIKNRAADIFWGTRYNPIRTVYFYSTIMEDSDAKKQNHYHVNEYSLIIQVFRG